jgi:hypothetical protein
MFSAMGFPIDGRKSGRFDNATVIDHLLMLLSADVAGERLICVYDGNNILALLTETQR